MVCFEWLALKEVVHLGSWASETFDTLCFCQPGIFRTATLFQPGW